MKQALKIVFVSALATAAFIKAVPALSQPPALDLNVRVVRTADLDLASSEGRRQLEQRLAIAARSVCRGASAVDLEAKNAERRCREEVLEAARSQVRAIAARNGGESIAFAQPR